MPLQRRPVRALAGRMGFDDECFRETVDSMIDRALDSPNPLLQALRVRGWKKSLSFA